jgi:hypothetical protein
LKRFQLQLAIAEQRRPNGSNCSSRNCRKSNLDATSHFLRADAGAGLFMNSGWQTAAAAAAAEAATAAEKPATCYFLRAGAGLFLNSGWPMAALRRVQLRPLTSTLRALCVMTLEGSSTEWLFTWPTMTPAAAAAAMPFCCLLAY